MSAIPPISTSTYNAIAAGSDSLERAAAEFNSPNPWLIPQDSAALSSNPWLPPQDPNAPASNAPPESINGPDTSALTMDPLVSGVADLVKARMQTEAGTALLRADDQHRQEILDLLKN